MYGYAVGGGGSVKSSEPRIGFSGMSVVSAGKVMVGESVGGEVLSVML